jgi:hypothetical protein
MTFICSGWEIANYANNESMKEKVTFGPLYWMVNFSTNFYLPTNSILFVTLAENSKNHQRGDTSKVVLVVAKSFFATSYPWLDYIS